MHMQPEERSTGWLPPRACRPDAPPPPRPCLVCSHAPGVTLTEILTPVGGTGTPASPFSLSFPAKYQFATQRKVGQGVCVVHRGRRLRRCTVQSCASTAASAWEGNCQKSSSCPAPQVPEVYSINANGQSATFASSSEAIGTGAPCCSGSARRGLLASPKPHASLGLCCISLNRPAPAACLCHVQASGPGHPLVLSRPRAARALHVAARSSEGQLGTWDHEWWPPLALPACPTLPHLSLPVSFRRFTSVPFHPLAAIQVKVKVINAATDADESRCPCVLPANTGTVAYLLSSNGANPYTAFVRIAFDGNDAPATFPIPRAGKWKFQLAAQVCKSV